MAVVALPAKPPLGVGLCHSVTGKKGGRGKEGGREKGGKVRRMSGLKMGSSE